MTPTPMASSSRPPRHAFNKALRGVMDQGGDAHMKDATSGPVRAMRATSSIARKLRGGKDSDAMQVDRAARLSSLASRIGPAKLSTAIRASRIPASSARLPTHEMWREFVKARYNQDQRFLDLSRISADPIVKKHNLQPPGTPGSGKNSGAVILKLASQLKPPPISITFAHNGLTSVSEYQTLPHYLPGLKNLSLEGNQLKELRVIECFAARKGRLMGLRELILAGNPMRENEIQAGRGERFQSEVLRRFPTLEQLDGVRIPKILFDEHNATPAEIAAAASIPKSFEFPLPMGPGLVPAEVQGLAAEFCTRFFNFFDNDRAQLAPIYAPTASMSFSVNSVIPPRAKVQGWHTHPTMPNQRKLDWGRWFDAGSRNLGRVKGDGIDTKLCSGIEQIGVALAKIPRTRHELDKPGHFNVDAQTIAAPPNLTLLLLTVHGQFTEADSEGVRSFDRTFMLAPSEPGSPAQMAGWPVVILSDMLVVRGYSSPEFWTPGPLKVQNRGPAQAQPQFAPPPHQAPSQFGQPQPQTNFAQPQQPQFAQQQQQPAPAPVDPQLNAILAGLPEPQRQMVLEFSARTGLTAMFAGQCLEGNGWDLNVALVNLEQVKSQLPAEAWARR